MKKLIHAAIAVALIMLYSCSYRNSKANDVSESFDSFYQKFTTDSLFQISRTQFPLKGYTNGKNLKDVKYFGTQSSYHDSLKINVVWLKERWGMHHSLTDTAYKRVVSIKDSVVMERIFIPNSEFDVKSVFEKVKGLWYLVYYYDVN